MCYKEEVQRRNQQKLQDIFKKDNVPDFIQRILGSFCGSKATSINYWNIIKDMLQYMIDFGIIKKAEVSEIKPSDMLEIEFPEMDSYLKYKEYNGMSPTTLYMRKNVFKSFWNRMIGTVKVPVTTNIMENVSYRGMGYNPNNVIMKLPSQENIEEMIIRIKWKKDNLVRERNLVVMSVLMGTGLRESELAGLDVSDLYLDDKTPYIKIVGKGKLRAAEARVVYLSENETIENIRHWLNIRNQLENIVDSDALFINRNGKRMVEDNIKSMFKNYSKGKITPHQIRHWYTTVFSQKYSPAFVQQQLGHRSIDTTINNYMDARTSFLAK